MKLLHQRRDISVTADVPNSIRTGRTAAEIGPLLHFNSFQDGGRPPSRILKSIVF